MPHGDTIIHSNGVELFGNTAGRFDLAANQLAQVFQVNVPGHKLGKGVGNGDDGFAEVLVFHAGGTPEGAGTGHIAAGSRGVGTILGHGRRFSP